MINLLVVALAMNHRSRHNGDGQCGYTIVKDFTATVSVSGQNAPTSAFMNLGIMVDLSGFAHPATIAVTAIPGGTAKKYWGIECTIQTSDHGICSIDTDTEHACLMQALTVLPQAFSIMYVFLSPLRDVTESKSLLLDNPPTGREGLQRSPETIGITRGPSGKPLHYIHTPGETVDALTFEEAPDVTPDGENLIFEVCGNDESHPVPKLLSVHWPSSVPLQIAATQPPNGGWPIAEPAPFLIHYHANTQQNKPGYYSGTYPDSFDYLHFIHFRDHNYGWRLSQEPGHEGEVVDADPLVNPWWKGIPYQIARARAHTVLVIPCLFEQHTNPGNPQNDYMWETGLFDSSGDFIIECLEEIHAQMLRKNGYYICQPRVGRVALSGHSAGNASVLQTLGRTRNHPFGQSVLKEVYMLDPHMQSAAVTGGYVDALNNFMNNPGGTAADHGDRRVRLYTQVGNVDMSNKLQTFVGSKRPSFGGSGIRIRDSVDGRKTGAILPATSWPAVADSQLVLDNNGDFVMGQGTDHNNHVHQVIAAMCLTDALTRSGFVSP